MKRISIIFLLSTIITHNLYADYITQNITGGCDSATLQAIDNISYLEPVFIINTYTCSAGQFLPANTLGCRECPSGYTCNGGTFDFNETVAQGINPKDIITANLSNACSSNILKTINEETYFEPIFEPNTVSLTWNDANGHTTTTTCEYGGLISLPPDPPARAGYIFNGWKVQNNNE